MVSAAPVLKKEPASTRQGHESWRVDDSRFPAALELGAQRELKVAFATFGKHLSETLAGRIELQPATAGATPVRVVPHVEGLSAELEVDSFIHCEFLEHAHVPILESRLIDDVPDLLRHKGTSSRRSEVG